MSQSHSIVVVHHSIAKLVRFVINLLVDSCTSFSLSLFFSLSRLTRTLLLRAVEVTTTPPLLAR
jgi:hypothetical protein